MRDKGDKVMKKMILKNYARLIVTCGVSVKKGDIVIINAGLEQPEFVQMLVNECYKSGASKVIVEWSYLPAKRLDIKYMSQNDLGTVETFEEEKLKYRLDKNPAMIHILSDDPDGLKGIDQNKYTQAMKERLSVIKPYDDKMDNKYKWCIAAAPGQAWAKKVFPGVRASVAVEKLWEAILYASRVIDKGGNALDPVEEWRKHNESFAGRCGILNNANLRFLVYHSSNGTDLKVGLMENGSFLGGGERTLYGEYFNPNIPSEEVFTTPLAGSAEGIVYSSMPLSWRGEIIDEFSLRFENGRVVEARAKKNESLLKQLVSMDEGAAMLGECAFVPYDSPIRESGIMFYETLFDENAACHLALGEGFTNTIRNYTDYTKEEMHKMGVNDSSVHVDFMIGNKDLCITGIREDGTELDIIKDGVWAF